MQGNYSSFWGESFEGRAPVCGGERKLTWHFLIFEWLGDGQKKGADRIFDRTPKMTDDRRMDVKRVRAG